VYFDGAILVEGSSIPTKYQLGLVDTGDFEADTIQFLSSVKDALKTLAELTGDVEYGVDENLFFFWKTESTTINYKFFVGNNVSMLERGVKWDEHNAAYRREPDQCRPLRHWIA
jgi:hypothetical protein